MRIRSVKPSFWADSTIGDLSYGARLFYIGLWNVADDAGWLDWDLRGIGAVLFPFEGAKRRESLMVGWAAELTAVSRVVTHPCGCAQIPTMQAHQRVAGNQSFTSRDRHERDHAQAPLTGEHPVATSSDYHEVATDRLQGATGSPGIGLVREGLVRSGLGGSVSGAREPDRYGLPHLDAETIEAAETASGRTIGTLNGWAATELDRLVEDRTPERVREALARCANGERPSWTQLVSAVRNDLEPLPGSAKVTAAERAAAEHAENLRRFMAGPTDADKAAMAALLEGQR